jgi:hypothetical protein
MNFLEPAEQTEPLADFRKLGESLSPEELKAFDDWETPRSELVPGAAMMVGNPFDTARLDDLLKAFHAEVDKMAQKAQSVLVIDDESFRE